MGATPRPCPADSVAGRRVIGGGSAMEQWIGLLAAAVVVGVFFLAVLRDVQKRHAEDGARTLDASSMRAYRSLPVLRPDRQ